MPGKRRKPPEPVRPQHEPPVVLRVGVPEVWGGDGSGPSRLRAARDAWRAQASAAGMVLADVWEALPAGRDERLFVPEAHDRLLELAGVTEDQLPALARQARAVWPWAFVHGWQPSSADPGYGWHLDAHRAAHGVEPDLA